MFRVREAAKGVPFRGGGRVFLERDGRLIATAVIISSGELKSSAYCLRQNCAMTKRPSNLRESWWPRVPSTRYQGSKRKILPWIRGVLEQLDFRTVLDVLGGTGSVSYLLKRMGKEVTYNDLLKCNYLTGRALIENDNIVLSDDDIDLMLRVSRSKTGFITETFQGMYFTDRENEEIDGICSEIQRMGLKGKQGRVRAAIASHALFQTCLIKRPFNLFHRANLNLRFARVSRTFGNKVTWETAIRQRFKIFCDEANKSIFKGKHRCKALNSDAFGTPTGYDLVYLDPPYVTKGEKNETSDYLKCESDRC